jgi:predicted metal-dependent hydrolase
VLTTTLGTTTIVYAVEERPRRRYPAIQVDANRCVTVLVPPGFPPNRIEPLLQQKARWILTHVAAPPRALTTVPKKFVSGEEFLFCGRPLQLEIVAASRQAVETIQHGTMIRLAIPQSSTSPQAQVVREALQQWFYQQALDWLPQRIDHYAPVVGAWPERLKIAEYKSRWGFCRDDGLIALNWRIVQAPISVMDYVVVHELTHRHHPHHQPTFWKAVQSVLPDYGAHKQWLKEHGGELGW